MAKTHLQVAKNFKGIHVACDEFTPRSDAPSVTTSTERVTCGNCRASRAFHGAKVGEGIRAAVARGEVIRRPNRWKFGL
jgi:hypothetical protein